MRRQREESRAILIATTGGSSKVGEKQNNVSVNRAELDDRPKHYGQLAGTSLLSIGQPGLRYSVPPLPGASGRNVFYQLSSSTCRAISTHSV